MSEHRTATAEINDAFEGVERTIKRETVWMPAVVSIGWGTSLGLVVWHIFTGDGGSGWGIAHAIILAFAIFQVWTFWDVDARRRVENLKFQTAANILDEMMKERGATWVQTGEEGSISVEFPGPDTDEEDETTEK